MTTTNTASSEPIVNYDILSVAGLKLDARFIVASLVDGSRFHEFKQLYGTGLLCGYGRINGRLVAIVANNGTMDCHAARKGAHFVHLATERRVPIVFLQNSLFHDDFEQSENTMDNIYFSSETLRARASLISAISVSTVRSLNDWLNVSPKTIHLDTKNNNLYRWTIPSI